MTNVHFGLNRGNPTVQVTCKRTSPVVDETLRLRSDRPLVEPDLERQRRFCDIAYGGEPHARKVPEDGLIGRRDGELGQ